MAICNSVYLFGGVNCSMVNSCSQGFTYPVRNYFLENILEMIGYRLSAYNQIDNYGQDKSWKMQKQTLRKRKSQIASAAEVWLSESIVYFPMHRVYITMKHETLWIGTGCT